MKESGGGERGSADELEETVLVEGGDDCVQGMFYPARISQTKTARQAMNSARHVKDQRIPCIGHADEKRKAFAC